MNFSLMGWTGTCALIWDRRKARCRSPFVGRVWSLIELRDGYEGRPVV